MRSDAVRRAPVGGSPPDPVAPASRGRAGLDAGGPGTDPLVRLDNGSEDFQGGDGNDAIVGGSGCDFFNGGAGNDTIHALDGQAEGTTRFGSVPIDSGAGPAHTLLRDPNDSQPVGCERIATRPF